MAKKFNIHDHLPPFDASGKCQRCGNIGTRDYADGRLCGQCSLDDVQEIWKTVNTSNTDNTRQLEIT